MNDPLDNVDARSIGTHGDQWSLETRVVTPNYPTDS